MCESETRPSTNSVETETIKRGHKTSLQIKTDLKNYNTDVKHKCLELTKGVYIVIIIIY